MLSCSIKDERYTDQVQALMNREDFVCFMAQTNQDYKTLSQQLYRVMSLNVVIRTSTSTLEEFRPPMSPQEAQQLGLDAFALDYIDGPEPVLAMLCSQTGVHRSGVTLNEHNDAQYDKLLRSGTINSWVTGRTVYNVRRRREYGPQAMTTVTRTIQPGKYWSAQPVDGSEKSALNRRLNEVSHEYDEMKQEARQLKQKKKDLEDQVESTEQKIVSQHHHRAQLSPSYHTIDRDQKTEKRVAKRIHAMAESACQTWYVPTAENAPSELTVIKKPNRKRMRT